MIAWTIAQIALLGALLALAAWGAESAFRAAGRPTRWAWAGALMLLVVLAAVAPLRAATERSAITPVVLPAATTTTTAIAEPAGLFATLGAAWQDVTAAATRTAQQGWSTWHNTVPAGTDRVLLTAWLLASIALLVVFAAVHLRFQRHRAQWPVGTVHGTTVRIAGDVGPAVIGVTKAEIVVPQWLLTREDREQALVLAHEREHVRVRDPLLLAVAQVVIVLLPWHPAVWWMASRLRLAVELDCDRRVLQRGASARDYGTLLIDLTDHRTGFGAALPAFSCTPSHLERRLIAMTPKKLRYPLVRVLSTGALASLALLAACEATLPTAEEVEGMTAARATTAAGRVALIDTTAVTYFLNGTPLTKSQADGIKQDSIASISVLKKPMGGEVRIVTKGAGTESPSATFTYVEVGDTTTMRADTIMLADTIRLSRSRPTNGAATTERESAIFVATEPKVFSKAPFTGLVVLDGVLTDMTAMNRLQPDRIERVEIIKGAAAIGRYNDPRAANGVIVITTKKAKP